MALDAFYWVCAYANNHWALGSDVSADPGQTSFRRALAIAVGTLSVLDASSEAYKRIWCGYEVFVTLTAPGKLYDVVTEKDWVHTFSMDEPSQRCAVVLADGLAHEYETDEKESSIRKADREENFPESMILAGLGTRIELGW